MERPGSWASSIQCSIAPTNRPRPDCRWTRPTRDAGQARRVEMPARPPAQTHSACSSAAFMPAPSTRVTPERRSKPPAAAHTAGSTNLSRRMPDPANSTTGVQSDATLTAEPTPDHWGRGKLPPAAPGRPDRNARRPSARLIRPAPWPHRVPRGHVPPEPPPLDRNGSVASRRTRRPRLSSAWRQHARLDG
jgi:hypothetical protein